jgi:hypothetical protein
MLRFGDEMEEEIIENRREHIRFELSVPLFAEFSLGRVKEKEIKSRSQRVLLTNISAGGCQLKTFLQIPPRDDVEWLLKLQLGKYATQLKAVIVRCTEEEGLQVYGLRWIMTGLECQTFKYRLQDYLFSVLVSSPHIHTLYRKIAARNSDGLFRQLDVNS